MQLPEAEPTNLHGYAVPDIMSFGINAQCLQAGKVQLLCITRVWFQYDLELCVSLHSVGVVTIPTVIWTYAGFWIAHIPGLRP